MNLQTDTYTTCQLCTEILIGAYAPLEPSVSWLTSMTRINEEFPLGWHHAEEENAEGYTYRCSCDICPDRLQGLRFDVRVSVVIPT